MICRPLEEVDNEIIHGCGQQLYGVPRGPDLSMLSICTWYNLKILSFLAASRAVSISEFDPKDAQGAGSLLFVLYTFSIAA